MTNLKILCMLAASLLLHFSTGSEDSGVEKIIARGLDDAVRSYGIFDRVRPRNAGAAQRNRASEVDPVVRTTSGLVRGVTLDEAHGFYEIPYAQPPLGDLRFREPRPFPESSTTIDARVNDNVVCYQPLRNCSEGRCFTNLNEDCLVLNIHTPRHVDLSNPNTTPKTKLPVLFFIHGGLFIYGSGTSTQCDGRWLSNATNTLVVTINYRLGAFGFLVYGDGDDALEGNQGLKDQQLAMQWVQDNIENFGGDKNKVTLFGHSAGAQGILFHLVSSVSQPLFQRAIMQSLSAFEYDTREKAAGAGNATVEYLSCEGDEIQCLVDASPDDLVAAVSAIRRQALIGGDFWGGLEPLRPYLDGEEWTDHPMDLFRDGKWHTEKQILTGTNRDESIATNTYVDGEEMSRAEFYLNNRLQFGEELGNNISQYYEAMMDEGETDYTLIYGTELTDGYYVCPTRALVRFAGKKQERVFLYVSAYAPAGPYCQAINDIPERCGLAYRTSELPVLFRSGPAYGYIFNDDDLACADQFDSYWGGFARTGDPSDGVVPPLADVTKWPRYKTDTSQSIRIEAPKESIDDFYRGEVCDFWDDLDFYVEMPEDGAVQMRASVLHFVLLAFAAFFLR